ncbi:MAG: DUF2505 domain-containing protein [Myxococcales bacterium FL481]|nr:MAG: DUF2505 domain-containing protein [Myxococcales bacterium FL481]
MPRYRIVDRFDTSPAHYWHVFFDPDFNAGLYQALEIEFELLELTREGAGESETVLRRARLAPRRELPAVLRKFVNNAVSYEQRERLIARDNRMEVETIPNYLTDRFVSKGIYSLAPTTDGVERTWQGECACKVPLVGGTIAKLVVEEVERSYRTTTQFTREWLANHPPE